MITLAKPVIPEAAIQKAVSVLKSGNLVQGIFVNKFEEALNCYLDGGHSIAVSSGTAALHLALAALDVSMGDEVIVPAFTFPATANVVELVGATPVLVDINQSDLCMNMDMVESCITDKTKAIIVVHEFGQAAEIDRLVAIGNQYDIPVIEDAACALGSEYNGKKIGIWGTLGCFSFHPRKAITTGEGGVVVTANEDLAEKVRVLRNHGICYGDNQIDFVAAGFNYRLTDFQAVLGLEQLKILDELISKRIVTADLYDRGLLSIREVSTPTVFENRRMVYQTYHIIIDPLFDRAHIIELLKKNGVQTNLGAQALHCLTYYRNKYNYKQEDFPVALNAYNHGLALPMGEHVDEVDIQLICKNIQEILWTLTQ